MQDKLSFTDTLDKDTNSLTITINSQKYIIRSNKVACKLHFPNAHCIKPLTKASKGDVNIITLIIETRTELLKILLLFITFAFLMVVILLVLLI